MATQFINMFASIAALVVGGLIGLAFGHLQNVARRKNEQKELKGELKSGWTLMPGSGVRVAYLLLTLVAIQFICPMLFNGGNTRWWASGGVVAGYGAMLFVQLRQRVSGSK